MQCNICEFRCSIPEAGTGRCRMYTHTDNRISEIYPDNYLVCVPAPIEAMPMTHYHPNSKFLQICTFGCNFSCSGCVSWIMTENKDSVKGAVNPIRAEDMVQRALDENCKGIMFCFNEPAVSFFTFKNLARIARQKGLLVGCATNGYFTEEAFLDLLDHIDFINIGLKGHSDSVYKKTGALSHDPIYRNLALSLEKKVHTEVAAVYIKGQEAELMETARHVASLSGEIPFQVMRFMPLAHSDAADEPSIKEAESLCKDLKQILKFVYLFNSPGTEFLDTLCPECGHRIFKRGFNGPMCSNLTAYSPGESCGLPHDGLFEGTVCEDNGLEALSFFGGYKNILSLENIRTILAFVGETDTQAVSRVFHEVLKTDYIKGLYPRLKQIPSYLDTVDYFSGIAGRQKEAGLLRAYIEEKVAEVTTALAGVERPRVYYALSNPLIAVFGDKFECNLVETAGGCCVNKEIQRDDIPGSTIPVELFNRLNPDIILVHGQIGYSVPEVYTFCVDNGMMVNAVKNSRIYNLYPYRTAGRPDWILGLLSIANLLHPDRFHFDVAKIADDLYHRLFGTDYSVLNHNLAFDVLLSEQIKRQAS